MYQLLLTRGHLVVEICDRCGGLYTDPAKHNTLCAESNMGQRIGYLDLQVRNKELEAAVCLRNEANAILISDNRALREENAGLREDVRHAEAAANAEREKKNQDNGVAWRCERCGGGGRITATEQAGEFEWAVRIHNRKRTGCPIITARVKPTEIVFNPKEPIL